VPSVARLENAVQRFLDHLEIERDLSTNTLAAYGTFGVSSPRLI
jgi:hypothetical protein